ncbi:GTP cyclohydrolase MptA [Methanococcoides burtonii]|uniref:GTP cyclohydrolase MptA n=1 Tax=Methanococcoides burtonii (strain DSM 6242 / NBRC 107633 / OCM 468 / ACE-M) TaxID=259564 RepID=MPTA_METBU|nr:GTP cyclohydrolase MptA [Methanococcoides burtonii]Q12ZQ0.1 RecName: Full=GTP cyclohydrolase MptA; AltName: Full=GTP cyclohydrolase IV [Methanococcoides burtonii DSM 6242]ABE51076.1 GTP cyclohydrolase MptA [Methanococcoides burtonii DSM 6242]
MELPIAQFPDVQANRPKIPINLTRVGVTGVKKLVEIKRKDKRPIVLISTFEIFVDLPSDRKGANLSRNFEAMDEVLEKAINLPVYEIEKLCNDVAKSLLRRHEYATRSEVRMKSEYVVKREAPSTKMKCQEVVDIFAEATATRLEDGDIDVKKLIGAEVVGMTACPCAQEIMRDNAKTALRELGVGLETVMNFLNKVPMATHNQRGRGIISLEVSGDVDVSLETIIRIIESSMSSSIVELLKRADEALVVERAHQNPKFVEDCVRTMAQNIVSEFAHVPDSALVTIKQINEESIHRHNAFAERVALLGDLRDEIKNN